MYRIPRTTAVVAMIAVVFHSALPTFAETGATIEGTVEIPCDPSRVSEVAFVQMRPVSGGSASTIAVDSSTGTFRSPGLTEGEYEVIAIGADGKPLSREPKKLVLRDGLNKVVLSFQPPGCGEQDSGRDKAGLKDWQLTLIFLGVASAAALALDIDDEEPASPF